MTPSLPLIGAGFFGPGTTENLLKILTYRFCTLRQESLPPFHGFGKGKQVAVDWKGNP